MPANDDDKWEEEATMTNGEAKTALAIMANCEPEEIRSWLIIVHIHPNDGTPHQARTATNCPPELVPHLILEGLGAL